MNNKKGEMTTQQIVILVILIASFVVILFFLFQLQFGNESDKDICRNSVVSRGSAVVPTDAVPLDCKRNYVCITKDNTCERMTNPTKIKVSNKEDVYEALGNELVDCWWMFGEGKVNYIGKDLLPNLYCSMCSQIAFDDSVNSIFGGASFSKDEFMNYLTLKNMSNSEKTYSQYLYDSNNIQEILSKFESSSGVSTKTFGTVYLDRTYYALTAITSDISNVGWVASGVLVGGAVTLTFVTGGIGGVIIGGIIGGTAAGTGYHFLAPVIQGESGNDFIPPVLIEANSDDFNSLECSEISSSS